MEDLESKTPDELQKITHSLIKERDRLLATATPAAITLATEFCLRGNVSIIHALMTAKESGDVEAIKKAQIAVIRLREGFNDSLHASSKKP